jgi:hypothetical protein
MSFATVKCMRKAHLLCPHYALQESSLKPANHALCHLIEYCTSRDRCTGYGALKPLSIPIPESMGEGWLKPVWKVQSGE